MKANRAEDAGAGGAAPQTGSDTTCRQWCAQHNELPRTGYHAGRNDVQKVAGQRQRKQGSAHTDVFLIPENHYSPQVLSKVAHGHKSAQQNGLYAHTCAGCWVRVAHTLQNPPGNPAQGVGRQDTVWPASQGLRTIGEAMNPANA